MDVNRVPHEPYLVKGQDAIALRLFSFQANWNHRDLNRYTRLLQTGPLSAIEDDFQQRISFSSEEEARKELASIKIGPGKIGLYNYLLQCAVLRPEGRELYTSIMYWLANVALIDVDIFDLAGNTALMYSISTCPNFDSDIADMLIAAGGKINHRNRFGCVAGADIAMNLDSSDEGKRKKFAALKFFIANGGNIDLADEEGFTVRDIMAKAVETVPELSVLLVDKVEEVEFPEPPEPPKPNARCVCGGRKYYKNCCGKVFAPPNPGEKGVRCPCGSRRVYKNCCGKVDENGRNIKELQEKLEEDEDDVD